MPWRRRKKDMERSEEDQATHDRHGVVRCKHCGAPTRFVSFAKSAGAARKPRLYVQCLTPLTAACGRRQSISCATDWRMLLPMWRTTPTYMTLRHSHSRYERVHHHWRVRWRSGADDHSLRPKRRGRDNQQLRANAALLIEWLMICWREGWLPDERPKRPLDLTRLVVEDGSEHVVSLNKTRGDLGLLRPYGPAAVKHGVGDLEPIATEDAENEPDPTEPDDLPVISPELDFPGENIEEENQPGRDAADVTLDDLPL